MKKIPQPAQEVKNLFNPMIQSISHRLTLGAINLKLFDELEEPLSAKNLASKKGLHQDNLKALLDCLCSIGLLKKYNGLYQNSPMASAFLKSGKETYLGNFFKRSHQVMIQSLNKLEDLIKNGPEPASEQNDFSDQEFWADYAEDMAAYACASQAKIITDQVEKLPEFSGMKKMLDLGGGPGIMALKICQAHPSLKAIVLDRPEVVRVSAKIIQRYEMQNRVEPLGRDYCKEDIGKNYDLILASCTLNFFRDQIKEVLQKIYDALDPGGVFISFHDALRAEDTQPTELVLSMSSMLFSGKAYNFRENELANAMLEVGFKSVVSRNLKTPMGELELITARK